LTGEPSAPTMLLQLYKQHRRVALGHRIHLAWALATAVEHFHRVGWVHKSIRSDNIAFATTSSLPPTPTEATDPAGSPIHLYLPMVGQFDLSKPLLFGFEYSRAGDDKTSLAEDFSQVNNYYRIPERWGRPEARFKKSHDVYSLGVVLLEVAIWKDIKSILNFPETEQLTAKRTVKALMGKCDTALRHQVGSTLTDCILACLGFDLASGKLTEYQAHVYFQQKVIKPLERVVRRI
jgi:serine/threonine protein kinase